MNPLAQATSDVFEILEPLPGDDRLRVVQAVFALLGHTYPGSANPTGTSSTHSPSDTGWGNGPDDCLPTMSDEGRRWVRKNGVELETLEHYFHFENGTVRPIAAAGPSTNKSEQTVNTYLLLGLASYLGSGVASFSDNDARDLCRHFGCFDSSNHAAIMKKFDNRITGSKTGGWKLTAPGLTAARNLLRSK